MDLPAPSIVCLDPDPRGEAPAEEDFAQDAPPLPARTSTRKEKAVLKRPPIPGHRSEDLSRGRASIT